MRDEDNICGNIDGALYSRQIHKYMIGERDPGTIAVEIIPEQVNCVEILFSEDTVPPPTEW